MSLNTLVAVMGTPSGYFGPSYLDKYSSNIHFWYRPDGGLRNTNSDKTYYDAGDNTYDMTIVGDVNNFHYSASLNNNVLVTISGSGKYAFNEPSGSTYYETDATNGYTFYVLAKSDGASNWFTSPNYNVYTSANSFILWDVVDFANTCTVTASYNNWHILCGYGNNRNDLNLYTDGNTASLSSATTTTPTPSVNVSYTFQSGVNGSAEMQIAEIVAFNRVLSHAERTEVEGYLAHKYDQTDILPISHPYYASAPV